MVKGFECTLVNGIGGDPAVHMTIARTGESILFDLGSIDHLSNREILKVRLALVSHAHVDHFIGFDQWLRVHVPHFRALEIVGPPGMIEHVRGKLHGYLWNLLEPEQLVFQVTEVPVDGKCRTARLTNSDGFKAHEIEAIHTTRSKTSLLDAPLPSSPAVAVAYASDGTRFEAIALDHGTPSLAYACQAPCRLQTRIEVIGALGLSPGSWIRDLQLAIGERRLDTVFDFGALGRFRAGDLAHRVLVQVQSRPVAYVTDIGFTRSNLERLIPFLAGVETLICETNYRDLDRTRASSNMHLTTRQAALIAAAAGVDQLTTFHVSNMYAQNQPEVVLEAAEFFAAYRQLDRAILAMALDLELSEHARSHS